jgi:hypothetical protein
LAQRREHIPIMKKQSVTQDNSLPLPHQKSHIAPEQPVLRMKVPAHVLFRKDHSLILWKPRGILTEAIVNEIILFIETAEKKCKKPFNRFSDLSALDAVDLNFKFVFDVGLSRRLSFKSNPSVKSAFYVTSPATTHYMKLHKLLTDRSPLGVRLFTDPGEAATWLGVPPDVLVHRE